MKERSKEKIADLLMDELMTHLSERGNIRKLLGEMTGLPIGPLVDDLVSEFERIVGQYHQQSLLMVGRTEERKESAHSEPFTPTDSPSTPLPVVAEEPVDGRPAGEKVTDRNQAVEQPVGTEADELAKQKEDLRLEELAQDLRVAEERGDQRAEDITDFREKLEELAKRVESEYLEKLEQSEKKKRAEKFPETEEPPRRKEVIEVGPGELGKPSRIPFRLDDSDSIYVHGVMRIPVMDTPCDHPFMLEEKGIDEKEFAFAIDTNGFRFFLSKINQNEMNVSRKGLLLLGRAEALQLRGLHESILNEFRAHGVVLPMEFGTVARGKTDLVGLATRYEESIGEGVDALAKSQWWTLNMYILDARIGQLFAKGEDGGGERTGRERARMSYSAPTPQKKFDVKLLEKILQKEKRLAESVHKELSSAADRAEVQTMVGFGSGSSDEWKLILKATYLVGSSSGYQRFTRAVTDLQYRHILFEPMLSVTGDVEAFSFLKR